MAIISSGEDSLSVLLLASYAPFCSVPYVILTSREVPAFRAEGEKEKEGTNWI